MSTVMVVGAQPSDAGKICELLDDYLCELSGHREVSVGAVDAASYPYLGAYWSEAGRHPFLIVSGNRTVGFALIRDPVSTGTPTFQVAEFYVTPENRRMGVGRQAAVAIFRRFPGAWELQVHPRNSEAVSFWTSAVRAVARDSRPPIVIHAADGRRFQFNFEIEEGTR